MKRILLLLLFVFVTLFLISCEKESEKTITQLTIQNESGFIISDIKWNGTELKYKRNPQSQNTITIWDRHLNPSERMTCDVFAGTGYIYLSYGTDRNALSSARTNEVITIEKGESYIFTFTDNTIIVE